MDVDRPRDAGDPDSEADWSATGSSMEQDSEQTSSSPRTGPYSNGGPCHMDCDDSAHRYDSLSYLELTGLLNRQILPNDDHERQCFDIRARFELGDPHVHYHAPAANGLWYLGRTWVLWLACAFLLCPGQM